MLDYSQVAKEIERVSPGLFTKTQSLAFLTPSVWRELVEHDAFTARIEQIRKDHPTMVSWQGSLGRLLAMTPAQAPYAVCAVDGSQIYPERHMIGISCFLINTAGCLLRYGKQSSAQLFSVPRVYTPDAFVGQQQAFSAELVDLVREEHEFALLAAKAIEHHQQHAQDPFVALFDGNLLFWHLESAAAGTRDLFLKRYCDSLTLLYQQHIPVAGYLSFSHFRDVVELVRCGMQAPGVLDCLTHDQQGLLRTMVESCTDNELLAYVLEPQQRTIVFYCQNSIVEKYPSYLRPCFVYLHSGQEIVRIEMPLWVAEDESLVNQICALCIDQCSKGHGYPVALAEAHAHAVVKSADREFFFHYIFKLAMNRKQHVFPSQKSLKKRIMGV